MADPATGLQSALNVLIEGTGPDPVMLHGVGGGIDDLVDLRRLIASGWQVISPDQRGHGRSPGGPEISYAARRERLPRCSTGWVFERPTSWA